MIENLPKNLLKYLSNFMTLEVKFSFTHTCKRIYSFLHEQTLNLMKYIYYCLRTEEDNDNLHPILLKALKIRNALSKKFVDDSLNGLFSLILSRIMTQIVKSKPFILKFRLSVNVASQYDWILNQLTESAKNLLILEGNYYYINEPLKCCFSLNNLGFVPKKIKGCYLKNISLNNELNIVSLNSKDYQNEFDYELNFETIEFLKEQRFEYIEAKNTKPLLINSIIYFHQNTIKEINLRIFDENTLEILKHCAYLEKIILSFHSIKNENNNSLTCNLFNKLIELTAHLPNLKILVTDYKNELIDDVISSGALFKFYFIEHLANFNDSSLSDSYRNNEDSPKVTVILNKDVILKQETGQRICSLRSIKNINEFTKQNINFFEENSVMFLRSDGEQSELIKGQCLIRGKLGLDEENKLVMQMKPGFKLVECLPSTFNRKPSINYSENQQKELTFLNTYELIKKLSKSKTICVKIKNIKYFNEIDFSAISNLKSLEIEITTEILENRLRRLLRTLNISKNEVIILNCSCSNEELSEFAQDELTNYDFYCYNDILIAIII